MQRINRVNERSPVRRSCGVATLVLIGCLMHLGTFGCGETMSVPPNSTSPGPSAGPTTPDLAWEEYNSGLSAFGPPSFDSTGQVIVLDTANTLSVYDLDGVLARRTSYGGRRIGTLVLDSTDRVYAAARVDDSASEGYLFAVGSDGAVVFETLLHGVPLGSPVLVGANELPLVADDSVGAFDANGTPAWRLTDECRPTVRPTSGGGLAFVACTADSVTHQLRAFDAAGTVVWDRLLPSAPQLLGASEHGVIVAFDPSTQFGPAVVLSISTTAGDPLWEAAIPHVGVGASGRVNVRSLATGRDGGALIATQDGRVFARTSDGEPQWDTSLGHPTCVQVDGEGTPFVATCNDNGLCNAGGYIVRLERESGRIDWIHETGGHPSCMALGYGAGVYTDDARRITCLRATEEASRDYAEGIR